MPSIGEHLLGTILHDVKLAEDLDAMAYADQAAMAGGKCLTFPHNVIQCLQHCDNYFTFCRDEVPSPCSSVIVNAKQREEISFEIREGYSKLVTMTAFIRNELLHPLIAIHEQMNTVAKKSQQWMNAYVQRQGLICDAKIELGKMLDLCAQQDLLLLKLTGNRVYAREEEK